jgi:hypothetical protein
MGSSEEAQRPGPPLPAATTRERLLCLLLGLGWSPRRRLLGLYRRCQLRDQPSRLRQLLKIPLEPWTAWRAAGAYCQAHGRAICDRYGISRSRLRLQLTLNTLRHGAQPDSSSVFWSFGVQRPGKWGCWIGDWQAVSITGGLNVLCAPTMARRVESKATFADWAREAGLPHVPLLAILRNGEPVGECLATTAAGLPDADLFAKPAHSCQGRGTRRWLRCGDGRWKDQTGRIVDGGSIVAELAAASAADEMVLQTALHPHPGIQGLAPDAVPTVRMVTRETEDGEVRVLRSTIRLPARGAIADNRHLGGDAAPVDLAAGRLGALLRVDADDQLFVDDSPCQDPAYTDVLRDWWPEIVALALEAQRAVWPMPTAGWDIAIAREGLTLLEGNVAWGANLVTLAHGSPLSETPYLREIFRFWRLGNRERGTSPAPSDREASLRPEFSAAG